MFFLSVGIDTNKTLNIENTSIFFSKLMLQRDRRDTELYV